MQLIRFHSIDFSRYFQINTDFLWLLTLSLNTVARDQALTYFLNTVIKIQETQSSIISRPHKLSTQAVYISLSDSQFPTDPRTTSEANRTQSEIAEKIMNEYHVKSYPINNEKLDPLLSP